MPFKLSSRRPIQNLLLTMIASLLGLAIPTPASAQCPEFSETNSGLWAWMYGPNTAWAFGNYGTQTVTSPSNYPGARGAIQSWTGTDGLRWIFGGNGVGASGGPDSMNDLWKWDPATGYWTWMNGNSIAGPASGSYGSLGVASSTNFPGSRYFHSSWSGIDGSLWLFGGNGYATGNGVLNDLWKYNTTSHQWTWMKGSSSANSAGSYGSIGNESSSNEPRARQRAVTFTTPGGELWLFGGLSGSNLLNDLWRYNPTSGYWTWMHGSSSVNASGNYGIKGIGTIATTPGARQGATGWTDSDGNFWLFGGSGYSASGSGFLNDLWKYDVVANQWIWMSGSNASPAYGVFNTQGIADSTSVPGGRFIPLSWIDDQGSLWLLGGTGLASSGPQGYLNDLWKYNVHSKQWIWVKGNNAINTSANYGVKGVAEIGSIPGARDGSPTWRDSKGRLWLFGGGGIIASGGVTMNDIWQFFPGYAFSTDEDTSITYPVEVHNAGSSSLVSVSSQPSAGTLEIAVGTTETLYYTPPPNWYGTTTATISVANGACETTAPVIITVNPIPDCPVLNPTSYTLTTPRNTGISVPLSILDPDGISNLAINTMPDNGTASVSTTSSVYYNPNINYLGTDTLIVSVTGGSCAPSTATVTINVVAPPDCPEFLYNDGSWIWRKESNLPNQFGIYGIQGMEDPLNRPGSRDMFSGWMDVYGNLWTFGGIGYGESAGNPTGSNVWLNDLWRFNPDNRNWTWKKGTKSVNSTGVYVTKGSENPAGYPSGRYYPLTWTGADGQLWLMGGVGIGSTSTGYFNDLWKYNPTTDNWTWVKGSSVAGQLGTYGAMGIPNSANTPGGRSNSHTWVAKDGTLWTFGAAGNSQTQIGTFLNDLWKFDPVTSNWTWMKGSHLGSQAGIYGTKGIADSNNTPGSRYGGSAWTDLSGNFWLFGGSDQTSSTASNLFNDLWMYNPGTNQWTWISGSNSSNASANYGLRTVSAPTNQPGPRVYSKSWIDAAGTLWVFGGFGIDSTGARGNLNDLWKFDTNTRQWTWVTGSQFMNQFSNYGALGVHSLSNMPGSRRPGIFSMDKKRRVWLFGGFGYPASGSQSFLNDVWQFLPGLATSTDEDVPLTYHVPMHDPEGNGLISILQHPSHGTLTLNGGTTETLYYVPPPNWNGVTTAVLSLTGGACAETTSILTITVNPVDDCPVLNPTNYIITTTRNVGRTIPLTVFDPDGISTLTITTPPTVGTATVLSTSSLYYTPAFNWFGTDSLIVTLSGGSCASTTATVIINVTNPPSCPEFLYNDGSWIWMKESNLPNQYGIYGTQNVEATGNRPGGRDALSGWTTADGSMWAFGGNGFGESAGPNPGVVWLNDLWRYNPNNRNWTWKKGTKNVTGIGNHGTQGVEASTNYPTGRYYHLTWTGKNGILWLMGGTGVGSGPSYGYLNDLWKYNPGNNNWTWVKGSSVTGGSGPLGTYGTKGIAFASNTPGGRSNSHTWVANDGTLWTFGGTGHSQTQAGVNLNDLWKFDPVSGNWTWIKGANIGNQIGVYGTKGIPDSNNTPGARFAGLHWTDALGNFWLFGGSGITTSTATSGALNDLWMYNPNTNQWTWVSGTTDVNATGNYGTRTVASPANYPSARGNSKTWQDATGVLWLLGGNGIDATGVLGPMNDLWKFDISTRQWTWVTGSQYRNQHSNYGTLGSPSPTNMPGSRRPGLISKDNNRRTWLFGGYGMPATGPISFLNDVWLFTPSLAMHALEDTPTTYTVPVFDLDGKAELYILQQPNQGTLSIAPSTTGTLLYVPPPDWSGVTTAVLSLAGGPCDETTAMLTIHVAPVNDPPVITSFTYSPEPACVNQLTTFSVTAYDIDGGPLNYYYDYGDGSTSDSLAAHIYHSVGNFTVTVEVNDGQDYVTSSILVSVIYPCPGFETDDWNWEGGSNQTLQPWNPNQPGARRGGATWAASDNTLWLFGGEGLGGINGTDVGRLGDLWRYDITSGTWTLKNNTTTASRQLNRRNTYVADSNTSISPGARYNAASWVDNDGNFWLFGGYGRGASLVGNLCDMWKFTTSTETWNCVSVTTETAIVSQTGWPAQIANWPAWRQNAVTWVTPDGNLWLFGGQGTGADGSAATGYLSDLWKYDINAAKWTLVFGSASVNTRGQYGPDDFIPGARTSAVSWADVSGNLYLFGGYGYGAADVGHLNDLWKYDTSQTTWTLLTGNGNVNQPGVYTGAPATLQSGGRYAAVSWYGPDGNLWLYGGWGYAENEYGRLNDLWQYDVALGIWRCVNRQADRVFHLPGIYEGTDELRPGGREKAMAWAASDGSFWLFGGHGFASNMGADYLSDLWSYGAFIVTGVPGTTGPVGPITVPITVDDPAGDAIIAIGQTPANGTINISQGTSTTVTYTPNVGFTGKDSATIKIYNSACAGDTATIIFNVPAASTSRIDNYELY